MNCLKNRQLGVERFQLGGNIAYIANAHAPRILAALSVGNVGYQKTIANIANKLQFIQWCVCIQYCMGIQYMQLGVGD